MNNLQIIVEAGFYTKGETTRIMDRRQWLGMMGATLIGRPGKPARGSEPNPAGAAPKKGSHIGLSEFQLKSMLKVPVTRTEPTKFPVIDIHAHISFLLQRSTRMAYP